MTEIVERLTAALSHRYRVERELGSGGMATVFLASDVKHDRKVALKVLRADVAAVLGAERFLQEIRISARLDHPHILTLIDSGEEDGILYYVLPVVRGESLRAKLEREKQLPLDEALTITRQVASALEYAHQRGIIHRDIKPENILIHEGEAVVTDFGIALALREAGGARLTGTGVGVGTPQYMSPEQATGDRAIDVRSDVYSLGAVLYEMLAGEPPHSGTTAQAVIAKLLVERPTDVRVLRETVPAYIADAVHRALAKTPADRFPTTAAFAGALARPTGSMEERPVGVMPRLGARSWRVAVTGIALVSVALVGGVWWSRQRAARRTDRASLDPRRVAVLYFQTRGGDSLRSVADGLTEGLIRELSRVRALQVVSPNGVLPFRHGSVPPDSVGRALKAGSLVDGMVAEDGTRLRVVVSLFDATDGTILKRGVFERPWGDLVALQDSVTVSVALFLRERLGEQVRMREDRRRASSAEAWRLVEEARSGARVFDSLLAAGDTALARRQVGQADTQLARAAALDPGWATPLTARGWLAWRSRYLMGDLAPPWVDQFTSRALQYADAARRLAPDDPDALALRGTARYVRHLFNLGADPGAVKALGDSAEADLRAATSADPNQGTAWTLLSHRLARTGRLPESKLAALRAYEVDPYANEAASLLERLTVASLDLEDRVETTRWCNEGRRRFPNRPGFIECQITVNALPGGTPDVPTMWRLLEQDVSLYPADQREYRRRRAQLFVAMALVRAALPDSARAVALRARAGTTIDPSRDLVYLEMLLRNVLGDREEALRLAAEYYAANPQDRTDCEGGGATQVDRTWWMRGLVDDPRFRAVSCSGR